MNKFKIGNVVMIVEDHFKYGYKNKRGEPIKCVVCKHNLVYSEEDKMFFCQNCGQRYD